MLSEVGVEMLISWLLIYLSTGHSIRLCQDLLNFGKNFIRRLGGIQLVHQVQLLKVPDDGHGGLLIRDEPLPQALLVVIRPATSSSSSAKAPGGADLLRAVEEQHTAQVHLLPHDLRPPCQIILVPREPVNEEIILVALLHRSLYQAAGDGHGDDGAVGDVVLDQLTVLAARRGPLSPEEVPGGEVHVPELLHDPGTLSALACPRPPQHEHHTGLGCHPLVEVNQAKKA